MTESNTAKQPLVTIITPAYNYADLMPETIDSILGQDYPNIEYLVYNDGSTDETEAVLRTYTDSRLKWVTQENMGEPRTVNRGFSEGNGAYFIVVNADDPVYPTLVSQSVEFMESHPDILVGYPRWHEIEASGSIIKEHPTHEFDFDKMVQWFHNFSGPGAIIRRNAIELAGMRDVSYRWFSDMDLWLRIGLYGSFARIPQVLATQRIHERARTQADKSKAMVDEFVLVAKRFFEQDDLPSNIRRFRNETISNAHYLSAAYTCYPAGLRSCARKHFILSFLYAPFAPRQYDNGMKKSWKLFWFNVLVPKLFDPLLPPAIKPVMRHN